MDEDALIEIGNATVCVDLQGTTAHPDLAHMRPILQVGVPNTASMATSILEWREPDPLLQKLYPVMGFEPRMLPFTLQKWVADISERMDGAPQDYAAVAAMVALGGILGRKVGIYPKRRDDWLVIPNLWGGIVGRPSAKKTPLLNEALKPLERLEAEAAEGYEEEIKRHTAQTKLDALQMKQAEQDAAKKIKTGDRAAAEMILLDAVENTVEAPTRKRYLVNDATVEKLHELLKENPMGLLIYRDELVGFFASMDRDGREQDRAFYLESWNGSGRFTYDRIGRGTIEVPSTTVSLLGGIQPGKLQPYLQAQQHGKGDDGLMQRLQMLVFPDLNNPRPVDRWPDKDAKNQAYSVFRKFSDIPDSEDEIPGFHFSEEGQAIFDDWYAEIIERERQEPNQHIEAHLVKYHSLMPTLALINHIAENGFVGGVSKEATIKAASWCEYLETHARRIYALADDPLYGARSLAKRLAQLPNPFRTKDFSNKGWAGLTDAQEVRQALAELERHGYLQSQTVETGTRTATDYYIHPDSLGNTHG